MHSCFTRTIPIIIFSIFLISCANTRQPKIGNITWSQHLTSMQQTKTWQITGKMAFNNSKQGANANFIWRQQGNTFNLELFGPFGTERSIVTGTPNKVTLVSHAGEKLSATTPEDLLNKKLGWHIPISGLKYWIRGIPAPNSPIQKKTFTPDGLLKILRQQDWIINYSEYKFFNNSILPSKITLNNQNLKVKIAIHSWVNLI